MPSAATNIQQGKEEAIWNRDISIFSQKRKASGFEILFFLAKATICGNFNKFIKENPDAIAASSASLTLIGIGAAILKAGLMLAPAICTAVPFLLPIATAALIGTSIINGLLLGYKAHQQWQGENKKGAALTAAAALSMLVLGGTLIDDSFLHIGKSVTDAVSLWSRGMGSSIVMGRLASAAGKLLTHDHSPETLAQVVTFGLIGLMNTFLLVTDFAHNFTGSEPVLDEGTADRVLEHAGEVFERTTERAQDALSEGLEVVMFTKMVINHDIDKLTLKSHGPTL